MSKYINAVKVIPSNTLNIPKPGLLDSGTSTAGAGAGEIEDTGALWTNVKTNVLSPEGYNISAGDIVYDITDSTVSEVNYVESDTVIQISNNDFQGATHAYEIYKGNKGGSEGYDLLVGAAPGGDVTVVTIKGDEVVIPQAAMALGSVLELAVIRVKASAAATAAKFVALELQTQI
tara:strand:- start:1370 stop:1897 length:528 start_codon:yes stop_codon:yes gene_type:complete